MHVQVPIGSNSQPSLFYIGKGHHGKSEYVHCHFPRERSLAVEESRKINL